MKKDEKKKLNTLDKYVILSLTVLILYTISALIVFIVVGVESKTLTICVYGAFNGEILQCYFIKRGKLHEEAKLVFGKKKELTNTDYDSDYAENDVYEGE